MFSRRVEPRAHAELTPVTGDDVLVTAGVGPHGEVVALWSSAGGREALLARDGGPGRPGFAATRAERPVAARLTKHGSERDVVVDLDLPLAHPRVQPLPEDRFLVVGARCMWRPEGAEHNAQVIDSAGDVVHTAVLGDGINDVATTPSGQTWVAYHDEGVYGNYGWGEPGRTPVGTSGLVRFDRDLEPAWDYFDQGEFDSIDDCYALNLAGETAWACYYSAFPVVRIDGDRVTGWTTGVEGASALVADGTRCALIGGYGEERDLVRVGELTGDGRFEVRRQRRLAPPGHRWTMAGRGDRLHLISGATHYLLDLDQLSA